MEVEPQWRSGRVNGGGTSMEVRSGKWRWNFNRHQLSPIVMRFNLIIFICRHIDRIARHLLQWLRCLSGEATSQYQ